jgi:putative transposase
MPRIGRAVARGYPHHVIQRGNNRENVFFEKEDRTKHLSLLNKYAFKWTAPIMAYCLMSNHIHLLTKLLSEESLFKMMQGMTLCYTQYINRMYGRTGILWKSRYYSCIVDHDKYLWAVARYIEQKLVRAKMVERAEDYSYLSARAHVNGSEDAVLGEDLFHNDRRRDYYCCGPIYIKKKLSACVMRQKREGLLVVRSLWSRWEKGLKEGSCSARKKNQERNTPKMREHPMGSGLTIYI